MSDAAERNEHWEAGQDALDEAVELLGIVANDLWCDEVVNGWLERGNNALRASLGTQIEQHERIVAFVQRHGGVVSDKAKGLGGKWRHYIDYAKARVVG